MDRFARHRAVAAALSSLSDRELARVVDEAPALGTSIGGSSRRLEIAGTPVFAKRVPLTELERRHARSTANVFELPTVYQYRIGSSGFAVWREVAAHELTTAWEIEDRCEAFPLLHHWRVLEGPPGPAFDLEPQVAIWDGAPQIRARLEAIARATASVVLFIEYVPRDVRRWLASEPDLERAFAMVEREALRIVQVMRAHDFLHLDPHFANILTDGERLYVSDFGLATSRQFALSEPERRFFDLHAASYDAAVVGTELANWLVAKLAPAPLPAFAEAILARHAQTALVLNEFYRRLRFESKSTPYPAEELERLTDRARDSGERSPSR